MSEKISKLFYWTSLQKVTRVYPAWVAYFWFIFVPIAARALAELQDRVELDIFGEKFPIQLALPFTWYIFYFASVCMTLAHAVIHVRAPRVILEHSTYSDFLGAGKGKRHLLGYSGDIETSAERYTDDLPITKILGRLELAEANARRAPREGVHVISNESSIRSPHELQPDSTARDQLREAQEEASKISDSMQESFWILREKGDSARVKSRTCASFFAYLGLALLLYVLGQSFFFVVAFITQHVQSG